MSKAKYIDNYINGRKLVLWGIGEACAQIRESLAESGIDIAAYTYTSAGEGEAHCGKPIIPIAALSPQAHYVFVAVSFQNEKEIVPYLWQRGFRKLYDFTSWTQWYFNPLDFQYYGVSIGKYTKGYEAYDAAIKKGQISSIGRYCAINERAYMGDDHPQLISTNAYLFMSMLSDIYNEAVENIQCHVTIGNDVWIGANSFINSSKVKTIGDGAIIAAGAVVIHDVPPYAIVGGVPAKILRHRFLPEQVKILLRVKWWARSDEWLYEHREQICDIEKFFEYFKDYNPDEEKAESE